jgi:hypothetical protein
MKKIAFLFLPMLLASCQYFDKQVPNEDELLQQRLKEIDWNRVSSYPSLEECDVITDKKLKKDCFFSTITRLIQEKLDNDTIAMMYPEIDTIQVKVTVFPDATLQFEPQIEQDSVTYNVVKIDSIIKARLVDFPKIQPAQKEGVPVKSQFIVPVILDVK